MTSQTTTCEYCPTTGGMCDDCQEQAWLAEGDAAEQLVIDGDAADLEEARTILAARPVAPAAKAPTDAEYLAGYDRSQEQAALALLASLPPRRTRTRKAR